MVSRGSLVAWGEFSGRVNEVDEENNILWIMTPEMWFIGIPAKSVGKHPVIEIGELPDPSPEVLETPRQVRRKMKKEKALAKRAKLEADKVATSTTKANVPAQAGWIDFRGSQALAPGSYKVIAGPFSRRSLGKGHITDETIHKCVKLSEGVYYVVLV